MGIRLVLLQFQISVAVMAILLLRAGIRRLPKIYSYGLWLLLFLRLLLPVQLESSIGLLPSIAESEAWVNRFVGSVVQAKQDIVSDTGTDGFVSGEFQKDILTANAANPEKADDGLYSSPSGNAGAAVTGNGLTGVGEPVSESTNGGSTGLERAAKGSISVLFLLWAAGVFGILGANGVALMRVRRRLRGAECYSGNVYISMGINTPFTMGLRRPRIYLPVGMEVAEQEYILCHERMHIKRRDYLVKQLVFLVTVLYWYNPFVWMAFYFLERDMEMACDEKVLALMGNEIKRQYSQSLLNFAKRGRGLTVTPFAFGENGVKQRVKNVLSYQKAKKWGCAVGAVALITAVMVLFTVREWNQENAVPDTDSSLDTQLAGNDGTGGAAGEGLIFSDENRENQETGASQQLPDFPLLETREQFEENYLTENSRYDFSEIAACYDIDFYRDILIQLTEGERVEEFACYTNPVFAAVNLLHLGAGSGSVEYYGVPVTVDGWELSWLQLMSWAGEGSVAYVTYTFDADGSQVEIPMVLVEGSKKLWALSSGMMESVALNSSQMGESKGLPVEYSLLREVYQTRKAYPDEQGEKGEIYIQTSQYGIYLLDRQGLHCVYPYEVFPDTRVTVSDDMLYFDMKEEDGQGKQICVLDLETGDFELDTPAVPSEIESIFALE